jgi:cysteine desulfurase/selenocysteine lyase
VEPEGINLIAKTWGEQNIGEGDEIIVSHLEHHANIVPWYQLTKKTEPNYESFLWMIAVKSGRNYLN